MPKYIVIFSGAKRPQNPQEFASVMETWSNWVKDMDKLVLDGGNPFSQVKTVASDSVAAGIDGDLPTGYMIIEADNMEHATQITQSTPVVQGGGQAVVHETFKVI